MSEVRSRIERGELRRKELTADSFTPLYPYSGLGLEGKIEILEDSIKIFFVLKGKEETKRIYKDLLDKLSPYRPNYTDSEIGKTKLEIVDPLTDGEIYKLVLNMEEGFRTIKETYFLEAEIKGEPIAVKHFSSYLEEIAGRKVYEVPFIQGIEIKKDSTLEERLNELIGKAEEIFGRQIEEGKKQKVDYKEKSKGKGIENLISKIDFFLQTVDIKRIQEEIKNYKIQKTTGIEDKLEKISESLKKRPIEKELKNVREQLIKLKENLKEKRISKTLDSQSHIPIDDKEIRKCIENLKREYKELEKEYEKLKKENEKLIEGGIGGIIMEREGQSINPMFR